MNKRILISILIVCWTSASIAQTPFTGGKGDGYAKASLSNIQLALDEAFGNSWSIYPQPAKIGQTLTISRNGDLSDRVHASFFSAQGQLIRHFELKEGSQTLKLPKLRLSPGVYLIHFQKEKQEAYRKIMIIPQ